MKTIFTIAWRNCWRNGLRTAIVVGAIVMGVWSSLTILGMLSAFISQRVDKMVQLQLGDAQIHAPTFDANPDISNTLDQPGELLTQLADHPQIAAFSPRFVTEASVMSPHGQSGVRLLGVNPEREIKTLGLGQRIQEGSFLGGTQRYPVLVGAKMAEKLQLSLRSRLQISFTNIDGDYLSKTFKVAGIFKAGDDAFDSQTIFVPIDRIEALTGRSLLHEVVLKASNPEQLSSLVASIANRHPNYLVESWKTRFPTIAYTVAMADTISYILMSIIVVALLFGIINTLTMSILERTQELGVLQAIGMSKLKIRLMIVLESLIYGLIGGPVGVLLGYLTILYFGIVGLDLSAVGQGMQAFGYDPIIYFSIAPKYYLIFPVFIITATIIAGIYPGRLATRLNPVTAIRTL